MENQNVWVSTPVSANCNAAAFHLWQRVASRWVKTQKRKKCDFWSHMVKSDWKEKSEKLCAFLSP
jgi:hypothetical protein